MAWTPSSREVSERNLVLAAVLDAIQRDLRIQAPRPGESSSFDGMADGLHYWFEGEDDLLHLTIEHLGREEVPASQAREVANFVLHGLSSAMVWYKPAIFSHHFYLGHDVLAEHLIGSGPS